MYKAIVFFYEAKPMHSINSAVQYLYSWLRLGYIPNFQHVSICFMHVKIPAELAIAYDKPMPFKDATVLSTEFEVLNALPMGEALKDCIEYIILEQEYADDYVQDILEKAEQIIGSMQLPCNGSDFVASLFGKSNIIWCTDFVLQCLDMYGDNTTRLLPDELFELLQDLEAYE